MFRPKDIIPDEVEHPDLTRQLQENCALSQADQQSLQNIRARLLQRRSISMLAEQNTEELEAMRAKPFSNALPERPAAGQLLPPPALQAFKWKNKPGNAWLRVAVIALLCLVVLSGTWYALTHSTKAGKHPNPPRPTPVQSVTPVNFRIVEMRMTSATVGWAYIVDQSQAIGSVIARTTDGGKTWQKFALSASMSTIHGYIFLDDQTAWVSMGQSSGPGIKVPIMHTTDGGQHWTLLHLPEGMDQDTFIDHQHGWAWPRDCLLNLASQCTYYKTTDAGKTWSKLGTASTSRTFDDLTTGPLPFSEQFHLVFHSSQVGWAIIHPSTQNLDSVYLYITEDGGISWQKQQLPQPATGPIPGIHTALNGTATKGFVSITNPQFFTSQHGVLGVIEQASTTSTPREIYLYETKNGGKNWSPLGPRIGDLSRSMNLVDPLDMTHILLGSMQKNMAAIYALVNGQWQKQPISQISGEDMIFFLNNHLGWMYVVGGASGMDVLYTTSDGGRSWHEVTRSTYRYSQSSESG